MDFSVLDLFPTLALPKTIGSTLGRSGYYAVMGYYGPIGYGWSAMDYAKETMW